MISTITGVCNNAIVVLVHQLTESVSVCESGKNKQATFVGYNDVQDLFNAFKDSFCDDTTFQDAVDFFKPIPFSGDVTVIGEW